MISLLDRERAATLRPTDSIPWGFFRHSGLALFIAALGPIVAAIAHDDIPEKTALKSQYDARIRPLLQTYCFECHDERPLIYHTVAAFGAGVWGGNHSMKSLPLMLIGHSGGRINQGETRTYPESTPLANAWLTMLQACGVPATSFADSTGTLAGLAS